MSTRSIADGAIVTSGAFDFTTEGIGFACDDGELGHARIDCPGAVGRHSHHSQRTDSRGQMTSETLKPADNDDGLSLIEVIVALLVSTIVLLAIADHLVNSWRTQNDVISTSEATNRGQVVSSSIERAMRNALFFEVSPDGTQLMVHTSLAAPKTCQAFRLADEVAEIKVAGSNLGSKAWGTWLEADSTRSWQTLVRQSGTTPFFQRNSETLTYTFDIETDAAPLPSEERLRSARMMELGGVRHVGD